MLHQIGLAHLAADRTADVASAWRRSPALVEYLDEREAEEIRARLRAIEAP